VDRFLGEQLTWILVLQVEESLKVERGEKNTLRMRAVRAEDVPACAADKIAMMPPRINLEISSIGIVEKKSIAKNPLK
jgi:hypothetical protein